MNATTQLETVIVNAEKVMDWAISSQALQGCREGSTTSAWSPDRTVKRHECGGGKECLMYAATRYSLSRTRKLRNHRIKSRWGNKLEIKGQGDTVRIRTAPTLSVSDYVIGGSLTYQVPTPIYQDMTIDKAKSFAFQVADVLEAQADVNLMQMYMDDASKQLKIAIADSVYFDTFVGATPATANRPAHAANQGATAGVKSGALKLGTDAAPIATSVPANLLTLILQMGAALDEQNAPDDGRWLLMSPYDRQILMQTNLAQAYFTGDSSSIVRTGKIGMIDRWTVYVSNMLPRGAAAKAWVSGQSDPAAGATYTGAAARRMIMGGTKDGIAFANQITKTEQVRNPNDFGDFVRGLSVYGRKVVKPEALVVGVVA